MLKIKNLNQTLQNHHILKSISLSIEPGHVTAFLGPNGAGKTTLLKTIMGLYQPPAHNVQTKTNMIQLNEEIINKWSPGKRVEHGLVYLPQQTSLFAQLSVLDNLALVYHYHSFWQKKPWGDFEQEVKTRFLQIDLTCPFSQKAQTLSGGQKRKLEVIRSILMQPTIVMFDEPFAGVDPKSIYELKAIFSNMAKENIAVVISDHNVDQLLSIAEHIYVVIDGKIVTSGGIKDILDDHKTKDAYFGNQFYTEISERFSG